jgi:NADPH:quinone reductase-like Zn-dependent oxidoreductase
MKAIICEAPGSPSTLVEHQVTIPSPAIGQALIEILGFGLNRGGMLSTMKRVFTYYALLITFLF